MALPRIGSSHSESAANLTRGAYLGPSTIETLRACQRAWELTKPLED